MKYLPSNILHVRRNGILSNIRTTSLSAIFSSGPKGGSPIFWCDTLYHTYANYIIFTFFHNFTIYLFLSLSNIENIFTQLYLSKTILAQECTNKHNNAFQPGGKTLLLIMLINLQRLFITGNCSHDYRL